MGMAKRWAMEQDERGYRWADGAICSDCVTDSALARWIEANLDSTKCRFCEKESEHPIAASFDDFVGVVRDGIAFDWNDPDSEGIVYESAEGGYQAELRDIWDLFYDYDVSENTDVIDALIDAIDTKYFVERDFYIGDDSQRLGWGWDWFKHVTKHKTRYLFLKLDDDDDDFPPSRMLDVIGDLVRSNAEKLQLLTTISTDVDLFRIRVAKEAVCTAAAIGTPPDEFAIQSNRMSPAGVPMFYGALDIETAKAETFDPAVHAGQTMSIGAFRALHDLRVLNLAELPDIPSVFDPESHWLIHYLRFLHAFARDIAQPIARDGREHIEYVPTQIVTEYFRRVFRDTDNQPLDGLIYASSKNPGSKAFVLFCENEQCVDAPQPKSFRNNPLLVLTTVEHQGCPPAGA